jgi:cytosine/adenosine deaminase-related metal-dependent hydrolase
VHPRLFKPLIDLAAEFNAPVAVHLAETQAERQLLSDGTGELVEMLEQFGVWNPDAIPPKSRPLDYLKELVRLDRALAIHGNYFDDEEIDFLSQHNNISVVYCPRTHAFFGHTDHPWRTMIDRGVAVAIGTDSRASNPDLSLWNELLFLRERHPQVPPRDLLQLGTQAGAQALGLDHRSGSIAVALMADIAAVSLNSELTADPYEQLFASNNEVVSTMIAGKWIDV